MATRRVCKDTYVTSTAANYARTLRKTMTGTEKILWRHLRANGLSGVKFRKQAPIGHYIVDFLSYDPRLIVEIDGSQHAHNKDYDHRRDEWLQKQRFTILRFWNSDVIENLEGVLAVILSTINTLRNSHEFNSRD